MAAEGLSASGWGNAPDDQYAPHRHDYDKVIVVTAGSITFELPEAERRIEVRAGDRLGLPAGTLHGARVGSAGVSCLEAHLPAGSLPQREPQVTVGWAGSGTVDASLSTHETASGLRT